MNSKILILIAVVGIGFVSYKKLFQSDDQKLIEAVIQMTQDELTINEPLKPMQVPSKLKALQENIISNFQVSYEADGHTQTYTAQGDMKSKAAPAALLIQKLSIIRTNTTIELRGPFADATFQAAVSGSTRGGAFSERVNVKLTFQKDGGDWKIRDAAIQRLF